MKKDNVEYEVLRNVGHNTISDYGYYEQEIKVLNDATEEEVRQAFDGPLTEINPQGGNVYTIIRYND